MSTAHDRPVVSLVGQPNSGKTTLFNRLTGARQKVGNYSGVTVEKRAGLWRGKQINCELIDLPGLYDLAGAGMDERIATTELFALTGGRVPELAVVVMDITQIERGLYLLAEVLHLGVPTVVALNMADAQKADGVEVDVAYLSKILQSPVLRISARKGEGIDELEAVVGHILATGNGQRPHEDNRPLLAYLSSMRRRDPARWQPVLANFPGLADDTEDSWAEVQQTLTATVEEWIRAVVRRPKASETRRKTIRIDDVILHPVFGMLIFMLVMLTLFQTVYAWSEPLIHMIELGIGWLAGWVYTLPVTPMLRELLAEAGLTGAGNVLVFLPQILILFLWIAVLEETGYLARVAFMLDRPMRMAGLSGRSFIPLLSSFACAVPGIMAARTIENPRTRLTTILVAPLMTCSARLPVYTLIVGAFIPQRSVWIFNLPGLVLFGLYISGVISALLLARMIQRGLRRGIPIPMILELPVYRWPHWRNVVQTLRQRTWIFIRRAGTIIFGVSVILWFALHFPRNTQAENAIRAEQGSAAAAVWQVEHSLAGRVGQMIEPVIRPLGFDWKIGVSLIASFTAREVMVATLGTIYNVEQADEKSVPLRQALRHDPVWDLPTALALLVWYIFALQCVSTVAIMRRETGGWKWPLGALASTYGLAWLLGTVVYQVASRV